MHRAGMLSIWFFIGLLLLAYGVLIFGSGLYEYFNPPAVQTVKLAELHAGIWWGILLLGMGVAYILKFRPGRKS
jgi:hypothetical protein